MSSAPHVPCLRSITFALTLAILHVSPAANFECPHDLTGKVILSEYSGCMFCHQGREGFSIHCPPGMKYHHETELCELEENVPESGSQSKRAEKESSSTVLTSNIENHKQMKRRLAGPNPFLPDYQSNVCKNDKPAESWMTNTVFNVVACCEKHFEWIRATCIENSNGILLGLDDPGVEEGEESDSAIKYYPDSSLGICKEDGPGRPSWITVTETDYAACCSHVGWNLEACLAAGPSISDTDTEGDDTDTEGESTSESDAEGDSTAESGTMYYPDTILGICKVDGPDRPKGVTLIESEYAKCCDYISWDKAKCLAAGPSIVSSEAEADTTSESYYPDHSTGLCKLDDESTPDWITTFFPDYDTCCKEASREKQKCLDAKATVPSTRRPTSSPTKHPTSFPIKGVDDSTSTSQPTKGPTRNPTSSPGSPAPIHKYYADSTTGLCKVNGPTKPDWIKVIYDDFETCCQKESWDTSKCLAAKPVEENVMGNDGGTDSEKPDIIIEINVFGSISMTGLIVPEVNSPDFSKLKIVLTKSIILTMQGSFAFHPAIDIQLWSIGGENFNWRRDLSDTSGGSVEENGKDSMHRYIRRNAKQTQVLKFEMTIPSLCNAACQTNLAGNLGQAEFDAINQHFKYSLTSGFFTVILNNEGVALGLFGNSNPSASSGELTYSYAVRSDHTWMPTDAPTSSPIAYPSSTPSSTPTGTPSSTPSSPMPTTTPSTSSSPTGSIFYGDFVNGICKLVDGRESEFEINFFESIEDCCSFPWIQDYDHCMEFSTTQALVFPPTSVPTPATPKPTRRPKKPTSGPTQPTHTYPTSGAKVYYPDLYLGICLSDGKQGSNPYLFSTPEACCTSDWLDYDKCMAASSPDPIYYPDFVAGFCRSHGGQEQSPFRFDNAEDCCDNYVFDYDYCIGMSSGSG